MGNRRPTVVHDCLVGVVFNSREANDRSANLGSTVADHLTLFIRVGAATVTNDGGSYTGIAIASNSGVPLGGGFCGSTI